MADYTLVSEPEAFYVQFQRLAAGIRCAFPGIIYEFFLKPRRQRSSLLLR